MSDATVELPDAKPQIIDALEVNRGSSDLRKNRKAVISTQMRSQNPETIIRMTSQLSSALGSILD